MGIFELFVLAVGLSMDAFAVSICKGLSLGKIKWKHMCIAGAWFGGFQALMPFIGYFFGRFFTDAITQYAHWIAFILLLFIGGKMVRESFGEEEDVDSSMSVKSMFLLAVATSIDAFVVGITLAAMGADITVSVLIIGTVTFIISYIGIWIGKLFGSILGNKAEIIGGALLVILGLKIFIEHMFIK